MKLSELLPIEEAYTYKTGLFTEDDLAVGGTIIYKVGDEYEMSKLQTKLKQNQILLKNGETVDVKDVVSTDASDWPRLTGEWPPFPKQRVEEAAGHQYYSPEEWEAKLENFIKHHFDGKDLKAAVDDELITIRCEQTSKSDGLVCTCTDHNGTEIASFNFKHGTGWVEQLS